MLALNFLSCRQHDRQEIASLKIKADSIAKVSQQTLLQNVAAAIAEGGTEYAVDFCHVRAAPITDSLSNRFKLYIQRISDRNRNPANGLNTVTDQLIFGHFKDQPALIDTLVPGRDRLVYYKRINLMMPTCLKCHGDPVIDIDPKTLKKITTRYPEDKATGYQLDEFRGLWKIEIVK